MKHVIIGSGIAGPITAMALQRIGHDAAIHEAYPRATEPAGVFLTVAQNGIDALNAIGLAEAVRAAAQATPTIGFRSTTGKHLGQVSLGAGTVTIARAALHDILTHEAERRGIPIHYESRLTDSPPDADTVIGCDGIRSRVRTLIDARAPGPRYTGLLNLGGFSASVPAVTAPRGTMEMIFGRRAFFGYTVMDQAIWWFANVPGPEHTRAELAAVDWRERLVALFSVDHGPASAIVAATVGKVHAYNTYEMPRVPTWHRGNMIIIGDAAHAASPSSGQGASMAVEDGIVLAHHLRRAPVGEAFAAFERERRPRVERVVAEGRRSSSAKTAGPIGRFFRDWLMPRFIAKVAAPERTAWLYDHAVTL